MSANRNLHYLGLKGARTLQTQAYLDIERAIEVTVEMMGICKVLGDAGVGKSYCAETILLAGERPYVRVIAASGPTPLRMGEKTAEGLGRIPRGNRFRLEDICREGLVDGLALVVDDAHVLPPFTIDFLRQLHDDPQSAFALFFIADPAFEDRLTRDRQLRSRLTASVDADPVEKSHVLDDLSAFHPVFRDAKEELLIRIRDDCVGGYMRDWAIFAKHAQREMKHARVDRLTDAIADAVIYLMGKRV